MEYVDILNEDGKMTGEIRLKNDAHSKGLWHKAAHVWIINDKKELLLQRHSPLKELYPNMWDISAAGHVSAGENSLTAALREIEEELGLTLTSTDLERVCTYRVDIEANNGSFINREFCDLFLVRKNLDITCLKLQSEEVSEMMWLDYKILENRLSDKDEEFVSHPGGDEILFTYIRDILEE